MTNMRRGFTMIELIFVIVIIGILAAVAIPKLAMTRSDAKGAKIANKLGTCINDASGRYMKYGHFNENNATDTIESSAACKAVDTVVGASTNCFTLTANDANGTLTIADNTSANTKECDEAQRVAALPDNNITNVTLSF